jgi:hypothetical protein
MPRSIRFVLMLVLVSVTLPFNLGSPLTARALASKARKQTHALAALSIRVQPNKINIGRDVTLHIAVSGSKGSPIAAEVSVNGAGNPAIGIARRGTYTVTVHAVSLGQASIQAAFHGYLPTILRVPIVAGPPASVIAV